MKNVLKYWHTIELVEPKLIPPVRKFKKGEPQRDFFIDSPDSIPWPGTPPEGKVITHFVYTGIYVLAPAIEQLRRLFPGKRNTFYEKTNNSARFCLGAFILDHSGNPCSESFVPGSFPWAMGRLNVGDYEMNGFQDFEIDMKTRFDIWWEKVRNERINKGARENQIYFTHNDLKNLNNYLLNEFGWNPGEGEKDAFVSLYEKKKNQNEETEQVDLLNSFYLGDLAASLSSRKYNPALREYLLPDEKLRKNMRVDLLTDTDCIKKRTSPHKYPACRWPSKFPLSLMQQVAVNGAYEKLNNNHGLFSVNGPPGTGKTTLLRDIIALIIFERAKTLYNFSTPSEAFKNGDVIRVDNYSFTSRSLNRNLQGFEIVVASSNNGAVENITREIPEIGSIDKHFRASLDYFRNVSDAMAGLEGSTWGIGAAVLGNSKNNSAFFGSFWIGENSLNKILKEPREISWDNAKKNFNKALLREKNLRQFAQNAEEVLNSITIIQKDITNSRMQYVQGQKAISTLQEEAAELGKKNEYFSRFLKQAEIQLEATLACKPGFLTRLFFRSKWKEWQATLKKDRASHKELLHSFINNTKCQNELTSTINSKQKRIKQLNESILKLEKKAGRGNRIIEKARIDYGQNFPDEEFWNQPAETLQKLLPWFSNDYHQARGDLFIEALNLHKAFILNAHKEIRANLHLFCNFLGGKIAIGDIQHILPDLWRTFFLAIPVASTTFASFSRLFRGMGQESLGWLLIDEAGQAVPQAAVGGIKRAQKVIILGDPFQIPPVVTTPKGVLDQLSSHYGTKNTIWEIGKNSVQALGDRVNYAGGVVNKRWIGVPLRVHRRCIEPMFSASNKMAYEGFMIQGTEKKTSVIGEVLGPSSWFDMKGTCQNGSNFIPEEGEFLKSLIKRLHSDPDLYIISPFKDVVEGIRRLRLLPNKQVGTVHTFQGKQAEGVIIVLGGGTPGARTWAGGSPNILNVALTRAKLRVYLIGNRRDWIDCGVFSFLKELPVITV